MTNKVAGAFATGVLWLAAAGFAVFGVQWLAHPADMARPLGIVLTNGDATSDARAVYGGMEVGLGLFLAYSAWSLRRRTQGLAAATVVLLCLGLSRFAGIVAAPGGVTGGTFQLLSTDLGGAALCAVALFVSRSVFPRATSVETKHGGQPA